MIGDRPRWLAVALALTMVTMGLTVATPSAAQSNEKCTSSYDPVEEGYVVLANPDEEPNRRVSRALYHFAFQGDGLVNERGRDYTNGIDAYVVDLECLTEAGSQVCIRRAETEFGIGAEGLELLEFRNRDSTAPDIRVAFYDATANHIQGGDWDPDVPPLEPDLDNGDEVCITGTDDLPTDARYAAVFLTSGNPAGVQTDEMAFGPYTSHFDLYYCLDAASTACEDDIPDEN